MRGMNNSHAMNTEEFAAPAKRSGQTVAPEHGRTPRDNIPGISAPVMGQAVNATLLER